MKNFIKMTIFIILFVIIWKCVFTIVWFGHNSISYFYKEPKESLDVIYIGSSNAYAHFNTVLAYKEYGFATGMLSSDGQPFSAVEYLVKEAKKYQSPKVYVIDITCLANDLYNFSTGDIRKVTDAMKFSKNRTDAVKGMLKYSNEEKSEYSSYYFSFLTYHNSWKYLGDYSFRNINLYKGHLLSDATVQVQPIERTKWVKDSGNMTKENQEIFDKLIKYIKKEKLNVIFVIPIRDFLVEHMSVLNQATEIANENQIKIINFNLLDDFDVDFQKDLYNDGHINVFGATKYTEYFSKYLKENYDLQDHRKDESYKSWDKEYNRYKAAYKKLTGNNFEKLIKQGE